VRDTAADTLVRSRPLTAQEEIYWRLTYNDQIHFVLAAEVLGETQVRQWRGALDSVQRRHPLLQVAIEMPGYRNSYRQPTFVPQQNAVIPLRVIEQSADEAAIAAVIQRELATPFLAGVAPLARAVLLYAPERSVVLLSLSHSIADGISGLILLRDLLKAFSGRSLATQPMPPTAEALLGLSSVSPKSAFPGADPRSKNAGRQPRVLLRSLSVDATKRLVATVRAHDSTVHGAVTAAFVFALRKLVPRFASDPVRVISPVSTRTELDAGDALGMYFTSPQSSFDPNRAKSFWDLAAIARADIARSSSREALMASTAAMQQLIEPGLPTESAACLLRSAFAMDLLLSNLGRVHFDRNFGGLRLEQVWGPAVLPGLEDTQAVGVVTTGDRLWMTLTSRQPVATLLESAIALLSDQIGR
jgi:hypothetical protein